MTRDEKRAELRKLRAYMDAHLPRWRETPTPAGEPCGGIGFLIELKDGTVLDFTLHMQPEPVTVEFGGTEFGEFEPGA